MKTRQWKIESGGWPTRNVRGLEEPKTWRQVVVALFCVFILPSAFCLRASGQSYSIDWYKIAGGGGTSTNGQYAVSGTIG